MPDADKLNVKMGLAAEIIRSVERLALSQAEAGARMGISQSKVSNLLRGVLTNLSERKLMDCLNRLGCDVEIVIRTAACGEGQIRIYHEKQAVKECADEKLHQNYNDTA